MPSLADILNGILCQMLKHGDIKRLLWIQHVNQVMPDAVHLVRHDLCRSDIKTAIDLHGICRDDLSADSFCKTDRQIGLSDRGRTGQYDQLFLVHGTLSPVIRSDGTSSQSLILTSTEWSDVHADS